MPVPVIAIFDIGKTNKKLFLFSEGYELLYEKSEQLSEITDEDGDACEDVQLLSEWLIKSLQQVMADPRFEIRALNVSAYGASFVYLDESGNVTAPLYNYLKPYPAGLQTYLFTKYGGEDVFCLTTASPPLGSLNSGLQFFRIRQHQSRLFSSIKWALHLPQFISSIITKKYASEITSIGCHTALWDYTQHSYHAWVQEEGLLDKLPPILSADSTFSGISQYQSIQVGIGLHDSSAALIPYLVHFEEPFVLISTGTWCISLHPFNDEPLTKDQLKQDCLCYFTYRERPVKASRLFAGNEHEQQIRRLADHFNKPIDYYKHIAFNESWIAPLPLEPGFFSRKNLADFSGYEDAYHHLMWDITLQQRHSTSLIMDTARTTRIFVDGGFSNNDVFMNMLAIQMPQVEVYAASMAQASALGAALAIHQRWNPLPLRKDLISLKLYSNRAKISNL